MKLKNKKTGENYETTMPIVFNIKTSGGGEHTVSCESITELNEKWEDYKEPKEYWYVSDTGDVFCSIDTECQIAIYHKEIGNYFDTLEEADKAVCKLKAWKRLKDKGFRFERWLLGDEYGNTITFSDYIEYDDETRANLNLLFGGEE